jgi:hypothetical protein
MGREIYRVPLDFDWPIGKTWLRYDVVVEFPKCWECDGRGYSAEAIARGGHLWTGRAVLDELGDAAYCHRCEGHGDIATPELREWKEAKPDTPPPKGEGWQLWETVGDSPMSPVFATSTELVDWMTCNPWMMSPHDYGPSLVVSSREVAERFVAVGWASSLVVSGGHVMDGVTFATVNATDHVPVDDELVGMSHRELAMTLGSWAAVFDVEHRFVVAGLLREAARRIGGDL